MLEELQVAVEQEPDVLKKQALLVRSRDASAKLARASANMKNIGSSLHVVVGFLDVMDKKLAVIENEFGEVGIDDDLLKKNTRMQADEEIIEMMNGY